MTNRKIANIKAQGFNMIDTIEEYQDSMPNLDFARIKVGAKAVQDAAYITTDYSRTNKQLGEKEAVLNALDKGDIDRIREISNFFFKTSGIYKGLCRYASSLYRYDWFITPFIGEGVKPQKAIDEFKKVLHYLDKSEIKRLCGDIALKVIRDGVYYGQILPGTEKLCIQELPCGQCRSTNVTVGNKILIEFNLKFFEDNFRDKDMRDNILKMFPEEFGKAYRLMEAGKLPLDSRGKQSTWFALDINNTVVFTINGEIVPVYYPVIPAIIDLALAQEIDRKKMQQQLLKLIIQKMPTDKNGELIFDVQEAKELHNNAVQMLQKAIGIDVLTTFADTSVETLTDKNTTTTRDELAKVERTVYNESGSSELLFNADNSVALDRSIINDEASLYNLILQFQTFFNDLIDKLFNTNPKKLDFRFEFLGTTVYNYKELSKIYKEQMQLGFGKMLPQIALGMSQSSILATAYFENDILDLINVFIPPLMSSTMNADILNRKQSGGNGSGSDNEKGGRPTNEESGKPTTEKTVQNKESKGNG